jgi:stalled ribosome rescue protein Dom34
MKKELGLWIDHSEALIVTLAGEGEVSKRIRSDMGDAPEGSNEDSRDRRIDNQLHKYYSEVVTAIQEADAILILGPGEAKGELKKLLEQEKRSSRTVSVETTDKLTEPQIVAKVRDHFQQ